MNITTLKYIVTIAELGSFHKAAKYLYISQPNLSNAVKSLENQYQIRIFNRTAKGISLTHEGESFIQNARSLITYYDNFEEYVKTNFGQANRRSFRFCMQYYPSIADAWCDMCNDPKYKNFSMQFTHASGSKILKLVANDEIDAGVVSVSENTLPSFSRYCAKHSMSSELLHTFSGYYIHIGKQHPLAHEKIIHMEQLLDYTRIDLGEKDADLLNTLEALRNVLYLNVPSIFVTDYSIYLDLLTTGNFFSYGSDLYLEGSFYSDKYHVVSKKLSLDSPDFFLYSVYNKNSDLSGIIEELHTRIRTKTQANFLP